jgi:hypothetical protein
MRSGHDHFGRTVVPGDRVELFRVAVGSTGGDALGWKGGIPGTVKGIDGAGRVLVEHDERATYQAPHDIKWEWSNPAVLVKV